jgi:hypothetical protein
MTMLAFRFGCLVPRRVTSMILHVKLELFERLIFNNSI